MTTPTSSPRLENYVPGHVPQKLALLVFGIAILILGLLELTPRLALLLRGQSALAEAVAVIKEKPGLPDVTFTNDVALAGDLKIVDRSYRYWNVFRYRAGDGTSHDVRLPSPAVVKPIYSISDEDGLPQALPVRYDPAAPDTAILFPTVFSTWVFPALLTFIGLLITLCATLILFAARRPIELPVLHELAPAGATPVNPSSSSGGH